MRTEQAVDAFLASLRTRQRREQVTADLEPEPDHASVSEADEGNGFSQVQLSLLDTEQQ